MKTFQRSIQRGNIKSRHGAKGERAKFILASLGLVACIIVVAVTIHSSFSSTQKAMNEIRLETEQTEELLNREYERQLELKAENCYYQSDAYYAKLARKRFNLIMNGDHVYVFG